jgi:hypothetical protein
MSIMAHESIIIQTGTRETRRAFPERFLTKQPADLRRHPIKVDESKIPLS